MIRTDILIAGGGAAGLMAASKASGRGYDVVLVEKGPEPGRKILITGKGRCNITNMKPWEDFKIHIHPDSGFLKNSFYAFSNEDVKSFFEGLGVDVCVERGNRLFPSSGKSSTVRNALRSHILDAGVSLLTMSDVLDISKVNDSFITLIRGEHDGRIDTEHIVSKAVILATGGRSYPYTGSNGSGYSLAHSLGHTIVDTFPSLTALMPSCYDTRLRGILLKNVSLSLYIDRDCVDTRQGEMEFTNNGIEGSLGYQLSRRAVEALRRGQKVSLVLDLKPALSEEQIRNRIVRSMPQRGLSLKRYLQDYLPVSIIPSFMDANPDLSVKSLPVKLKKWVFHICTYTGYERCVVTAGGVSLQEVSRKSMESKIVRGLFFAGEVLDLDGDTGGYNLQIAFSTGACAASGAVSYLDSLKNSDSGQK